MQRWMWVGMLLALLAGGGVMVWKALDEPALDGFNASVIGSDLKVPAVGFKRVDGTHAWQFPQDLGPHPDYQREQWRIRSSDSCAIRFDVLFERATFVPTALAPPRASDWAMQSLLTGSFTLANADGERLADAAVFSRAAVGLAGADERRVWIENWAYNWADETLVVSTQDTALDLVLSAGEPATPGSEEGWYTYSIAGRATGRVNIAGEPAQVACAVTVAHRFGTF